MKQYRNGHQPGCRLRLGLNHRANDECAKYAEEPSLVAHNWLAGLLPLALLRLLSLNRNLS